MAIIFVDGPDFSGKTTLAKQLGDYSDWSITRTGQELREYWCADHKTTKGVIEKAKCLWTDWFNVGTDRKRPIHVDRSPLSTLVEQIISDDTAAEDDFIQFLVGQIKKHGAFKMYFITVDSTVIEEREAKSTNEKDAREAKRSARERNALYHLGMNRLTERLKEHCDVRTELVNYDDTAAISLTALSRVPSLDSYFTALRVFVQGTMTRPNSESHTPITPSEKTVPIDWLDNPLFTHNDVVRALNYTKEWIIHNCELRGVAINRKSSIVTALFDGEPVNSNNVKVNRDDGYFGLIDGYIKRIETEYARRHCVTLDFVDELIGHHDVVVDKLKTNRCMPSLIAALLLTYYQKDTPPWHI